jgi:hypothetical protein
MGFTDTFISNRFCDVKINEIFHSYRKYTQINIISFIRKRKAYLRMNNTNYFYSQSLKWERNRKNKQQNSQE